MNPGSGRPIKEKQQLTLGFGLEALSCILQENNGPQRREENCDQNAGHAVPALLDAQSISAV